jgi:hypothetical protein
VSDLVRCHARDRAGDDASFEVVQRKKRRMQLCETDSD